jgi:hypothetical protein
MAAKVVPAVGGVHRLYALPRCFVGILDMIEHILLFVRSFSATRNFVLLIPSSYPRPCGQLPSRRVRFVGYCLGAHKGPKVLTFCIAPLLLDIRCSLFFCLLYPGFVKPLSILRPSLLLLLLLPGILYPSESISYKAASWL